MSIPNMHSAYRMVHRQVYHVVVLWLKVVISGIHVSKRFSETAPAYIWLTYPSSLHSLRRVGM